MAKRPKKKVPSHLTPLDGEIGTIFKDAPTVVALGYPAPYSVGVSSLGAQTVYRELNGIDGLACGRFYGPERGATGTTGLVTLESRRKVGDCNAIAFSVSCETELLEVVALIRRAGLEPLRTARKPRDPPIIIGGPITLLDPRLVAPFCDVVAVGESEVGLSALGKALVNSDGKQEFTNGVSAVPGMWLPELTETPPPPSPVSLDLLPAFAATWSPRAEFKNLFLIETTRGCKRGCAFCVLSARADGASRFRPVPIESIISAIPDEAPGVGLVGAAVTDHPEINELVRTIVNQKKRVSLSSIRADRLTVELAGQLKRGGLRTLTIAADGCSDGIRQAINKGISTEHLRDAAAVAREVGLSGLKIYTMVGLPSETDGDVADFCTLLTEMARNLRVSVAAQTFVPKPGTPLGLERMEDEAVVENRLGLMRKITKGRIKLLPTSWRWSWLDWKLAHGGERTALVAIQAHRDGGSYSAWRKAVLQHLENDGGSF